MAEDTIPTQPGRANVVGKAAEVLHAVTTRHRSSTGAETKEKG